MQLSGHGRQAMACPEIHTRSSIFSSTVQPQARIRGEHLNHAGIGGYQTEGQSHAHEGDLNQRHHGAIDYGLRQVHALLGEEGDQEVIEPDNRIPKCHLSPQPLGVPSRLSNYRAFGGYFTT